MTEKDIMYKIYIEKTETLMYNNLTIKSKGDTKMRRNAVSLAVVHTHTHR